ncbi:hypothetical protein GLYMA_01G233800v4 [Glycine max]|uniref:Uncharacterized protein n=1 Tax=Glycine max TaxID=3847 RepID=K7K5G8_SOYBN|nr:hypothetical protein GYH30_002420 [Glycine max]KRH77787.1 hypothetical protein GLYMA_01G233800v4 [Glycine max]
MMLYNKKKVSRKQFRIGSKAMLLHFGICLVHRGFRESFRQRQSDHDFFIMECSSEFVNGYQASANLEGTNHSQIYVFWGFFPRLETWGDAVTESFTI